MSLQLSSLVVPSLFAQTILEASLQKNALTASGVIPISPVMSSYMAGPGEIFTLPSLINPDATNVTANVPTSDSSVDAVPEVITGHASKFLKNSRNRSFNVNGIVPNMIGLDPLAAIVSMGAKMIDQWRQASLLAQLSALLNPSTGAVKANATTISLETTSGLGSANYLQTNPTKLISSALGAAWGDAGVDQVVLIMHSDAYYALMGTNTTAFLQPAIQNPQFKSYIGYPVLIDDNIGKRAGTTSGTVYTIYAVKVGGVEFGTAVADRPLEIQARPLQGNGAGGEIVVLRDIFGYHIPGTSYSGTIAGELPTNAELATPGNYSLVYAAHKAVGIASINFNIGP